MPWIRTWWRPCVLPMPKRTGALRLKTCVPSCFSCLLPCWDTMTRCSGLARTLRISACPCRNFRRISDRTLFLCLRRRCRFYWKKRMKRMKPPLPPFCLYRSGQDRTWKNPFPAKHVHGVRQGAWPSCAGAAACLSAWCAEKRSSCWCMPERTEPRPTSPGTSVCGWKSASR